MFDSPARFQKARVFMTVGVFILVVVSIIFAPRWFGYEGRAENLSGRIKAGDQAAALEFVSFYQTLKEEQQQRAAQILRAKALSGLLEDYAERSLSEVFMATDNQVALLKPLTPYAAEPLSFWVNRYTDAYLAFHVTYEELLRFYGNMNLLDIEAMTDEASQKLAYRQPLHQEFIQAENQLRQGDFISAATFYSSIPTGNTGYDLAQRLLSGCQGRWRQDAYTWGHHWFIKGNTPKALQLMEGYQRYYGAVDEVFNAFYLQVKARFEEEEAELVSISASSVEHIFTHSLIAYPQVAFSIPGKYLAADCLTPLEFRRILQLLYDNDYMLIDINTLYEIDEDDKISLKTLKFPAGKKPFVLSVDDASYDHRKATYGQIHRLIVDENGNIAGQTTVNGVPEVRYDNEIFPILESFIAQHPDFSFRGARGTLALTGFDGVFGYRTQVDTPKFPAPDRENEIVKAKKVAECLKSLGWTFASHGYAHSHMAAFTAQDMRTELQRWRDEVGSIVGDTQIFVWPYGERVVGSLTDAYKVMTVEMNFRFFCGVGANRYIARQSDGRSILQDRKAFDGNALTIEGNLHIRKLFDPTLIKDPIRNG